MNRKHTPSKRYGRLSIDQVAYCFEELDKGASQEALAFELRISTTTLRRYLRAAERYGFSFWSVNRSDS